MTEEIETLNPVSGLSERFATKDFSSNPDSKKMIEFFEDENLSREISERLKMDFITGTELASFLSRTKTARLREELNAYVKTRE